MKDICLNCGSEHESELWGAKCNCDNPNVVHQIKCSGCDNIMGYIIGDDYCDLEKLYCPICMMINNFTFEYEASDGTIYRPITMKELIEFRKKIDKHFPIKNKIIKPYKKCPTD